ncbi:MAG: hypothetical protein LR011_03240 [Verrucomicrobia bacterium]|nr:hypothetical protein [Verrucomicrobiota bacterium]
MQSIVIAEAGSNMVYEACRSGYPVEDENCSNPQNIKSLVSSLFLKNSKDASSTFSSLVFDEIPGGGTRHVLISAILADGGRSIRDHAEPADEAGDRLVHRNGSQKPGETQTLMDPIPI